MEFLPTAVIDALKGLKVSAATGWSFRAQSNRTTLLLKWETKQHETPYQQQDVRKRGPRLMRRQRRETQAIQSAPARPQPPPPPPSPKVVESGREKYDSILETTPLKTAATPSTVVLPGTAALTRPPSPAIPPEKCSAKILQQVLQDAAVMFQQQADTSYELTKFVSSNAELEPVEGMADNSSIPSISTVETEEEEEKVNELELLCNEMEIQEAFSDAHKRKEFIDAVTFVGHKCPKIRKPTKTNMKFGITHLETNYRKAYRGYPLQELIRVAALLAFNFRLDFPEIKQQVTRTAEEEVKSMRPNG